MAAIARLALGATTSSVELWSELAAGLSGAVASAGLALRDCVLLVPYAALIDPARRAFAARGGWQPRVETALTLAASLGPEPMLPPEACSGEGVLDRLQAATWLARLEPAGTDHTDRTDRTDRPFAAAALAEAAAALRQAAFERSPGDRAAFRAQVDRALAGPADGPGALETLLLRAAAAWAAAAPPPATDRLFELRPAAWAVLRLGGPDALAEAVLQASDCGGWLLDADPPATDPFGPWSEGAAPIRLPQLREAADFEAEALATATAVLDALRAGAQRVALVALDRVLLRRVTSLLQRRGLAVDDETGWKLSTTAAAGQVLARLRAAAGQAEGDDRLDWLKHWAPAASEGAALRALERSWRAGRDARLRPAEEAAAQALWHRAEATLAPWRKPGVQPLAEWLLLLTSQLEHEGVLGQWQRGSQQDPALERLLELLNLGRAGDPAGPAWRAALAVTAVDLDDFTRWFESLCESTTVQRAPQPSSRVVLTPLARALGRPFDHVVMAGADPQRLGRDGAAPALIADALAARIGLETADQRRQRQRLALAQLLRSPALTVLWRRQDGDTPLGPAGDLQWLLARAPLQADGLHPRPAALSSARVAPRTVHRPRPTAAQQLPLALSASAVDALRQCPYRFFSRSVLRLREDDELDQPARKRDYGDWLHATLHAFHRDRQPSQDDAAALQTAAEQALRQLELDPAAMLAFRASMGRLLPEYLRWLADHEAQGWQWHAGEDDLQAEPPDWAPQRLNGRIDRIDAGPGGARLVLDYKTGSAAGLRQRLKDPQEDTQLPFYAALLAAQPGADGLLRAAYLALDESEGPKLLEHPDVTGSAALMVEHLGQELKRLRQGAAMPALGEGEVCETCEVRGLCRRDEWTEPSPAAPEAEA